jgi:hypothetical protein
MAFERKTPLLAKVAIFLGLHELLHGWVYEFSGTTASLGSYQSGIVSHVIKHTGVHVCEAVWFTKFTPDSAIEFL